MMFYHDKNRDILVYEPVQAMHAYEIKKDHPEARTVDGKYLAVPRTLPILQHLRWLNYPVPPIITDDNYDWPHSSDIAHPYASQKLEANFVVLHRRCFDLSDMGAGKTLAMLWAADFLMRQQPEGSCRALVIAPLSILERVWADEIFKNFLSQRTFTILHGTAEKRLRQLEKRVDFYICNFEGVSVGAHTRGKFKLDGFSQALAARSDIQIAIVDEASAYKDARTKRHRIAQLVFGQKPYLWLATGTPTGQAPTDAYGLAKLVNNAHGKSFTMFRNDTMYKLTNFKWVPLRDGYDKARRLLTPAIRIPIETIWDGPELTTQQRAVDLTEHQKRLMKQLGKELRVVMNSGQSITAVHEAAARLKFLQISLGAVYDEAHKAHYVDAKPRLEELRAVIREASGKLLVFAGLTSIVNFLYSELKQEWPCEVVYGATSPKERARIFQAFQSEPEPRLLIADPGTMAHGLNLYAARTVVWFGPVDKSEIYQQANKRAHRPGQRFPVTIVQLVSNQLEREMFRRREKNMSDQSLFLDAVSKGEL